MYDVLDWIMEHAGYQNMKYAVQDDILTLRVRSITIATTNHADFIQFLNHHIIEGELIERPGAVQFNSEYESVQSYIPKWVKKRIIEEAEQKRKSQQDMMESILVQYYSE